MNYRRLCNFDDVWLCDKEETGVEHIELIVGASGTLENDKLR